MRCLRFSVGSRSLAIDLSWVREVCPMVRLNPVPGAPAWLRGLMDYHGTLLPAADLGALLGEAPVATTVGARILLLEGAIDGTESGRRALFGLLVDHVDAPATLERSGSWSAQAGLPDLPFLHEVASDGPRAVLVLDAGRLASQHAGLLQGSAGLAPLPGRVP
jgi:chemotaxis-related protein WspB